MGIAKTNDHIKIKIKMPNPSQEPPASTKSPIQDLKDVNALCTFKMQIESKKWEYRGIKSRSRYKPPVRNLQPPSKPQIRT